MGNSKSLRRSLDNTVELSQFVSGSLFSEYFLTHGIQELKYWEAIESETVQAFLAHLVETFKSLPDLVSLSETEIEDLIINKILDFFHFYYSRQTRASRYVPDYSLYSNQEDWRASLRLSGSDKWEKADCLLEAKAGNRNLDARNPDDSEDPNNPSNKIISYLETVWRETNRRVRFAFLTNGREWRVYARETDLRSKKYLSFKFEKLATWLLPTQTTLDEYFPHEGITLLHLLKLIIFFLSPQSHQYIIGLENKCVLDIALAEGKLWERKVTDALKDELYEEIIPLLANGMKHSYDSLDEDTINSVYQTSILLLYRLLIVMFAEDRNILPRFGPYSDYSLLNLRLDIANRMDEGRTFSSRQTRIYEALRAVFQIMTSGDSQLQVPAYNGRLFDDEHYPTFQTITIPDYIMSEVIDRLSRDRRSTNNGAPIWINYAELSVRHLGSIYESLLRFQLQLAQEELKIIKRNDSEIIVPITDLRNTDEVLKTIPAGELYLVGDNNERKATGSYFTPDYIVRFITEETLGLALVQFKTTFEEMLTGVDIQENRTRKEKIAQLRQYDPLARMLRLRILDPAVGSGHFLVYAFEFLREWTESILGEHYQLDGKLYQFSPLTTNNPNVDPLIFIERLILRRCLYGVDINPLAVELAQVSLWLTSFTSEFPLSFLDHHIRVGNTLLGIRWRELQDTYKQTLDIYISPKFSLNQHIESLLQQADISSRNVRESQTTYDLIQEAIHDLKIICHLHLWTKIHTSREDQDRRNYVSNIIRNYNTTKTIDLSDEFVQEVVKEANTEHYFHTDLEFIDSLLNPSEKARRFDFILTNPPYGGEISTIHKKYFKKLYKTHKDTAAYFTVKMLSLCKHFGIILPKTLSFYSLWADTRFALFRKADLMHVMDTGLAFEDVNYETIILIGSLKRKKHLQNAVSISVALPLRTPLPQKTIIAENDVPYDFFNQNGIIIFRGLSEGEIEVVNRITQNSISLGELVESSERIFRGPYIPDKIKRKTLSESFYLEPNLVDLPDNHFVWINKIPHVQRYWITRYYDIDLSDPNYQRYLDRTMRTTTKRVFIKVLRGNRLVSYVDSRGELCTTEKLVNVLPPEGCTYSLFYLCGIINSPYPSFYLANVLFSKTTETSRVMDYAYSSLIPIPKVHFTESSNTTERFQEKLTTMISDILESSIEINKPDLNLLHIEDLISENYENPTQGNHDALACIVEEIINLHKEIKQLQYDFFQFVSSNYPSVKASSDEKQDINYQLLEKIGHEEWPTFRRRLERVYSITLSEYRDIIEVYSEKLERITKIDSLITFLTELSEEIARKSFDLDETHKRVVENSLSKKG